MKPWLVVLLGSLLLWALPAPAQAQDPVETQVYAIARKLYCPVCEQTPLDDCPTLACHQWRQLIRQMLLEGRSEEEILAHFVERYGEQVLAAPPTRGFNLAAWLVPGAAFAAGLAWLLAQMRGWLQAEPSRPPPPPEEYLRRAEEELGSSSGG